MNELEKLEAKLKSLKPIIPSQELRGRCLTTKSYTSNNHLLIKNWQWLGFAASVMLMLFMWSVYENRQIHYSVSQKSTPVPRQITVYSKNIKIENLQNVPFSNFYLSKQNDSFTPQNHKQYLKHY